MVPNMIPPARSGLLTFTMGDIPISHEPPVTLPRHEECEAQGIFVIAYNNPLPLTRSSIGSRYMEQDTDSVGWYTGSSELSVVGGI